MNGVRGFEHGQKIRSADGKPSTKSVALLVTLEEWRWLKEQAGDKSMPAYLRCVLFARREALK